MSLTGIGCNRSSPYVEPANGLLDRNTPESHCNRASGAAWVEYKTHSATLALKLNAKTPSWGSNARTRLRSPWQWPLYTWQTRTPKVHRTQAHGQLAQRVPAERWPIRGFEILATYDIRRVFSDYHNEMSVFTCRWVEQSQQTFTSFTGQKKNVAWKVHTRAEKGSSISYIPTFATSPPSAGLLIGSMHFLITCSAANLISSKDAKSAFWPSWSTTSITQ